MKDAVQDPGSGRGPGGSALGSPLEASTCQASGSASGSPMAMTSLPRGWCLVTTPGSEASALFLPGGDLAGTIVVNCAKASQGCPSILRAMGRIPVDGLPGECDLEMDWEVLYQGLAELAGNPPFLSVTQGSMTTRTNLDPHTAYSLPRDPREPGAIGGWRVYSSATKVRNTPFLDHMLIGFNLLDPGLYTFKPPRLEVVLPSGERMPFPRG